MDSTASYTDKPCRHIIQEFLRKVLRLAANRLHDLCSRLEIEDAHQDEVKTHVWDMPKKLFYFASL